MAEGRPRVAYFCMEFGLNENFHIYAGGLGILAGDILKGAREYDFPLIGVGILWRQGYNRQFIGEDGRPYDAYPTYQYDFLEDTGVTVSVFIREREVKCKVWKVDKFANAPLYLLDTNHPDNADSWITGQLYGWFSEERIAQEMVLGIGGIRALRKLGIDVDIYHFNEGHAVFAGLELIKEKMERGDSFREAWEKTREEIVFTTHTPVKEGNEVHSHRLLQYMGAYNGLTYQQMKEIGGDPFNMTVAGLRLSRMANGVARLHGETVHKMWGDVADRAPMIAITNGVHRKSWVDDRMVEAFKGERDIWETHQEIKNELIEFVEDRTGIRLAADKLLFGFARRAAPYKRADLIFSDEGKVGSLLEEGKIQIIFSGKAHPLDDTGKGIIARLVKMAEKYPRAVVFLEDYNIEIGRRMTRGVDVWLNNPRRPLEASGTSGMKAAMNGVLNCSILDGWWPEMCEHGVNGWQFGDGYEGEGQDEHDVRALYQVLFEEVIPAYYHDRERWVKMMRQSFNDSYECFSIKKMLEDYYQKMYVND